MRKTILIFTVVWAVIQIFPTITLAVSKPDMPSVHSESAVVYEAKTGKVLYEKNAETRMYPASLTKIATAIYAIENGNLEDMVTVSEKAYQTGGSSVFLEEGDQATLKQLIQGLLLNSGNDAGVAIAEHLSGSVEQFAIDLNEYLEAEVGVQQTTFKNPHGLFDSEHKTTAKDLAVITGYAQQNEAFNEIYGLEVLDWDGEKWDAILYTHHRLIREDPYEGVTGGKTGFVPQSGFTLATSATRDGMDLVVITMKSSTKDSSYEDTKKLLDYGFENYETSMLAPLEEFPELEGNYQVPESIPYTHLKDHQVETEVNASGEISIGYPDGETIHTTTLEKVKKQAAQPPSTEKDSSKDWQNYWPLLVFPRHFWVTEIYEEISSSK